MNLSNLAAVNLCLCLREVKEYGYAQFFDLCREFAFIYKIFYVSESSMMAGFFEFDFEACACYMMPLGL